MLAAAAVVMVVQQWDIHSSQEKMASYIQTIHTLIPTPQGAAVEERRDNTMSVLSIEGRNFVGILEMPKYNSSLPVSADWGEISKSPCRLSGSVYDRTMQIGATTQKGQYDFYREISVGDSVFFTDMEGNRFAYRVTDIRYEKNADQSTLHQKDGALTLFLKNIYGFEYIVIFCDTIH